MKPVVFYLLSLLFDFVFHLNRSTRVQVGGINLPE